MNVFPDMFGDDIFPGNRHTCVWIFILVRTKKPSGKYILSTLEVRTTIYLNIHQKDHQTLFFVFSHWFGFWWNLIFLFLLRVALRNYYFTNI